MRARPGCGARAADDHRELDLVVELARDDGVVEHRLVRADHRVRGLQEELRLFLVDLRLLVAVIPVVLSRVEDDRGDERCEQPHRRRARASPSGLCSLVAAQASLGDRRRRRTPPCHRKQQVDDGVAVDGADGGRPPVSTTSLARPCRGTRRREARERPAHAGTASGRRATSASRGRARSLGSRVGGAVPDRTGCPSSRPPSSATHSPGRTRKRLSGCSS